MSSTRFVQAKGFTRGRPDGPPLWIVWHDMEASERFDRAETTAAYFADPPDRREVSAHFCVDDNSVVQCVAEADTAWAVGNRPGNNRGISVELAGYARQSRAQWLDRFGLAMFATAAPVVAASMTRWRIPNRWCTQADLQARRPGHTTHSDLRIAFGQTTHTDPGTGFPRDHVLDVINQALRRGDPVPDPPVPVPMRTDPDFAQLMERVLALFVGLAKTRPSAPAPGEKNAPHAEAQALADTQERLVVQGDEIIKAIGLLAGGAVASGGITPEQLAEALRAAADSLTIAAS